MKVKIWLALIAIYLAWGSTYLAIHFAVQTIPPFFMTGTRFLIAGLVLYIFRRLAGDPAPSRHQWRSTAIIGNLLLVGGIGGVSWAEQYVPSGIAALIIAATPLWVLLIDTLRVHGRRPTWINIAGVLVGLSGMLILIDPIQPSAQMHGSNLVGIAVLLLAGFLWALGTTYSHEAEMPKSSLLSTGMQLLAGSAGSYVLGLATGELRQLDLSAISLRSVTGLSYLIVVGSLVGFVCYTWLLRVAPTPLVVTYAYVNPLVAILLGSLLAQEALTPRVLVAAPLILSAVVLIQKHQAEVQNEPVSTLTIHASAGED